MKQEFRTLVFTINDKEEWNRNGFKIPEMECSDGKPFALTAMSLDHEIRRVSEIEETLNDEDLDDCDKIEKIQQIVDSTSCVW